MTITFLLILVLKKKIFISEDLFFIIINATYCRDNYHIKNYIPTLLKFHIRSEVLDYNNQLAISKIISQQKQKLQFSLLSKQCNLLIIILLIILHYNYNKNLQIQKYLPNRTLHMGNTQWDNEKYYVLQRLWNN